MTGQGVASDATKYRCQNDSQKITPAVFHRGTHPHVDNEPQCLHFVRSFLSLPQLRRILESSVHAQ